MHLYCCMFIVELEKGGTSRRVTKKSKPLSVTFLIISECEATDLILLLSESKLSYMEQKRNMTSTGSHRKTHFPFFVMSCDNVRAAAGFQIYI